MSTIESVLASLKWRYAVKSFDPERKIDPQTWNALEDSLVLSPSSFGLQPWNFLVITSQETKEKLVEVSWGQRQLAEASHVVVFLVKNPLTNEDIHAHLARTAEIRGVALESLDGFRTLLEGYLAKPPEGLTVRDWASRQVYIALGNFMTTAALLGIDTCPMEGLDPKAYDRLLGLEGTGYETLAACPAGFRNPSDKYSSLPKVRFPKEKVIQHIP